MCNVANVQTIDTERTCLTSQIFAVVDFAKHRLGKRRLYLRYCSSIRQYSHGSMFMPSAPQLEQLRAISETIEQKWWERVKYRNSSLTTALPSEAKLSLVWIMWPRVCYLHTTFVKILHQFKRKKNLQTCVCGTHLSGKCHHCKTVSSCSNVVCHQETALMLICDRRCAQVALYLGEKQS